MGPQLAVRVPARRGTPANRPGRQADLGCPETGSSTIDCENQKLTEDVGVAGTPYRLSYSSDWAPGGASRSFDVAVTPSTLPDGLLAVELKVQIAGQKIVRRYADPADFPDASGIPSITPEIVEHIEWDGLDGFGEPVVGAVKAHLTLNYYYQPFRYESRDGFDTSWAQIGAAGSADAQFGGRQCLQRRLGVRGRRLGAICAPSSSRRRDAAWSARRGATTSGSEDGTSMRITSTTRRPAWSGSETAPSAVPARSTSAR